MYGARAIPVTRTDARPKARYRKFSFLISVIAAMNNGNRISRPIIEEELYFTRVDSIEGLKGPMRVFQLSLW
jgi:hypothetical protein